MNNESTPLWIQRVNWNKQYQIDQHSGDKRLEISSFLIHHISPVTNDYHFTVTKLTKHFNCSRSTVYRTIRMLKGIDTVHIAHGHIKFRQYTPINNLGGDANGNK